ncbi:hypothetical protein HU200_052905 [Digitaria exilis]|uniref:HMA domain-containing protein n=1 Tax=Digitaria exilis TaxID=1010633 RepID=A0A835AXN5_9POAL|nr:hypothetical protein HU200_052905 [Digitaria exilis]CAB3484336.1 unnamed protein product [Digitaria exilis]
MGKEARRMLVKAKEATVEEKQKGDNGEEKKQEAPPPPPEEIEMRVYMHCKGCAKKVKKILMKFDGVEDVFADATERKVIVKGKKVAADPMKVVEHIKKKTKHIVELISPVSPPPEEKKEEEKEPEPPKPEMESPMIIVVLKMRIHCKACAQWIEKRILNIKGVQYADVDLKASEVKVTGMLEVAKLAQYVYKRTGKHVVIIKSEPLVPPESANGDKANEEEKAEGGEEIEGGGDTGAEENNNVEDTSAIAPANICTCYPQFTFPGGYYSPPPPPPGYFYQAVYPPPSYAAYAPHHQMMAPQIFSDENPNACSVM